MRIATWNCCGKFTAATVTTLGGDRAAQTPAGWAGKKHLVTFREMFTGMAMERTSYAPNRVAMVGELLQSQLTPEYRSN